MAFTLSDTTLLLFVMTPTYRLNWNLPGIGAACDAWRTSHQSFFRWMMLLMAQVLLSGLPAEPSWIPAVAPSPYVEPPTGVMSDVLWSQYLRPPFAPLAGNSDGTSPLLLRPIASLSSGISSLEWPRRKTLRKMYKGPSETDSEATNTVPPTSKTFL